MQSLLNMRTDQLVRLVTTVLLVIIGINSALFGLLLIKEVLVLFFVAFILASALRPTVLKLKRRFNIPLAVSALSLELLFFAIFALFLTLVVPPLAKQSTQLVTAATQLLDIPDLKFDLLFNRDAGEISRTFQSFESFFNRFGQSLSGIFGVVNSVLTTVILTVTLFVIIFYIITSYDHIARAFAWMLPGTNQEKVARAERMLEAVSFQLGGWIRGRVIVMILIGIITYIGLSLLGIPYALPLALAATILEIIPNIGPILAAIPALILAFFFVSPLAALSVMVFYIVLQQVESSIFTPQVMRKAVDVHPLTTVFLILVGLHVMGVKGGLLVLPFYVAVRSVGQELWPDNGPFSKLKSK